ncbi:MAG TPA: hypothetical protein VKV69_08475 [Actinomycetota bacterium]|nr:hypothetical protein [Actinomycetota bacterium]
MDAAKHILWVYPSLSRSSPAGGFYFPDDAFFTEHGTGIIANEEENHTIVRIAFPSGRVTWTYGHPRVAGSGPGYLDQPDDAYLLKNGMVMVADARNCRIIFIDPAGRITNQIGHVGACRHNPPYALAYPNGDTPLRNGDILVSEVNGSYVDEISPSGGLKWSVHVPLPYPSDPQQIGPDRYLVASYARPGGLLEFTHTGRVLWKYRVPSGAGMLDHPSLAAMLPGGFICVNDDYRDRVVIIDPRTNKIVWQYGHTDRAGRAPGYLSIPDGFDLLALDGSTPTHPYTG